MNIIIADIDGCCLEPTERIHHFLNGDLDAYHAEYHKDTPIKVGITVYRKFLTDPDFTFLFVTGRQEAARGYTLKQLQDHVHPNIHSKQLLMRPNHISSKDMHDTELKPMLITSAGYSLDNIFMVFEDRNSIVEMWRSRGIPCYHTQPGDF